MRSNFAWMTAGNVIFAACQWVVFVVIAKLGTPDMLGQFAFGLAVATPVMQLSGLQLRNVQATDARRTHAFGDCFGLRLLTTGAATLVVLAVGGVMVSSGRSVTGFVVMLVGVARAIENVSDVCYGLFQQREQMRFISVSMVSRGLLTPISMAIAIETTGSVAWGAAAVCVCWVLVLIGYDVPHARAILAADNQGFRPSFDWKAVYKLARLASPLGVVAVLWSLNATIPRYFLAEYRGERELGFFTALFSVVLIGYPAINAVGQAAMPRLAAYHAAVSRRAFVSLTLKLILGAAAAGTIAFVTFALAGRTIVSVLYTADYARHSAALIWLALAGLTAYVAAISNCALMAAHKFKALMSLMLSVMVLLVALCFWFTPSEGLDGTAKALFIALVWQAVVSGVLLWLVIRGLRRDAQQDRGVVIVRSTSVSPCPRTEKAARALHADGWSVRIVGCDRTGRMGDELRSYASVTRLKVPAPYGQKWRNIPAKLRWNAALLRWLTRNRTRFSVIHATSLDTVLPAIIAKWFFGKRLVYDIYDSAMGETHESRLRDVVRNRRLLRNWLSEKGVALVQSLERWAVNRADAVVLPDEIRYVFLRGCRPRSVTYIYNSPEPVPLPAPIKNGTLKIAYIGLLIPDRGLHEMIDVVAGNPEFELDIAGFGMEAHSISGRMLGAERMRFHGQISYERALEISERADVLFSTYNPARPFQRFNTPNKLFEALMLGKPFIVSQNTGHWESVVEHDIGMAVTYGDKGELATALSRIHRMSLEERTSLAHRARRLYDECYGWEMMRERLISLYSTLPGLEAGCAAGSHGHFEQKAGGLSI